MQINGNQVALKQVFKEGTNLLKSANIETPVFEAGVILCHILQCDRTFLYTRPEFVINQETYHLYIEEIRKRSQGIPLQHITGHQEFMSLDFKVSPAVLIPRQDTEILVETVILLAKEFQEETLNILDIGTGSGCIAASLAYYLKNSQVTALDVSLNALEIARTNAERNGVGTRVSFLESNLFSGIVGWKDPFKIIVSNPPYIPSKQIELLQVEVKQHEPISALDGGPDGLDFYRRIIDQSPDYLASRGFLAFEVGYDQAKDVAQLMEKHFTHIKIHKDLSYIDRVVVGQVD